MLGARDSIATIAVKNLDVASPTVPEARSSSSTRPGMPSTNQATCVTWAIDDVEQVAQELDARGVTFEHCDFPGTTVEGDVHVEGDRKAVWFKDPTGAF
jgi:hypothetical protein